MKKQIIPDAESGRRAFLKNGLIVTLSGAGFGLFSCENNEADQAQEISPPEDLMQEHGVLNRILLIYDICQIHLIAKTDFPRAALAKAANIIRTFIEDYHEKQEEQYLFPRFKKAGELSDLIDILSQQHQAGRKITDRILHLTKSQTATDDENRELTGLLNNFTTMYRPHEAREDTVLFPAFRKIVSRHEYDSLGEEFEKNEHKLFGDDGFEAMVDKVATVEKSLGIYDLARFTPKI